MTLCSTAALRCWKAHPKHIRQRDLLGLVERIASLLVTGCANDRQQSAV